MKSGAFKNKGNREAAFAGKFYPELKQELTRQLNGFFKNAEAGIKTQQKLQAVISPHAGYVYSGKIAASAFNQIPESAVYKRVFVLASSHQFLFQGAAVYCNGNYETPLGEIKVDTTLSKKLAESYEIFEDKPEVHQNEHSLEVQLPFLQQKLGNSFQLVPIILGTNQPEICKKIAHVLKPWFTSENLFVISSDFSHYPEYSDATKVDFLTAEAICNNQSENLQNVLKENKKKGFKNLATSLCGWTSVLTLLYLTEKNNYTFKKISYQNSGDSEPYGDKNRVVGYWAIAVFDSNNSLEISEKEKKEILDRARNSIIAFVETGKKVNLSDSKTSGILNEITGVFVSIYINDKLRGCIGGFAQEKTLNYLVQQMAASAACDRRFENVKPDELEIMKLEISVLSPLKKIKSIDEIVLGKHGIFIKQDYNSGTFLPQVATKMGWDMDQYLGHCSRDKAGIGWDGWKTAEIYVFEAIVFKEI